MAELGLNARIDAIGNVRGVYPGFDPTAGTLLIGSHVDTVVGAGAYDGVLGVMLALALIKALDGERFPFAIEVIAFSEEEGVRFQTPFLSSRAVTGTLTQADLQLRDASGVTVEQAIRSFNLDPAHLNCAKLDGRTLGFLEFHIEQGPVLDNEALSLAVVDSIAGQSRLQLVFTGKANHAGTTPMPLRCDALAGACEWVGTVENAAQSTAGLVATVGRLKVLPGASNVIPGEVHLSLDVRHASNETRVSAVNKMLSVAQQICIARRLSVEWQPQLDQCAVKLDSRFLVMLEHALVACGQPPRRMMSGAGHDAMILAGQVPSAMVFLRSPGGISHHPDEAVMVTDVELAIRVGLSFLHELSHTYR